MSGGLQDTIILTLLR